MEKSRRRKKSAIEEDKPTRDKFLPYGLHWIDEDDIQEVVKVLKSDWITQGPKIREFEKALAKFTGAKYAVALSSGTAALHAACFAAGIAEGDEVITTPITFVASSNCVLYMGGRPVFADIEEDTYNIDPDEIQKKITNRTKAIIPVDFAGHPVDLDKVCKIAKSHNLVVIEDAAHALGAEYKGKKIGSISDMTIFSFHPVKHITTGEGGVVTTNNEEYYEKLLMFRTHGITRNFSKFANKRLSFAFNFQLSASHANPWYYEMQELGYNYRITDFQAALGLSQLRKLNKFISRRRGIVKNYNQSFQKVEEIIIPYEKPGVKSSWHIYVIRMKLNKLRATRREIFEALRKEEIGVNVHYIPVYYHSYYKKLGYKEGLCPKAERYYEEAITLPLFPKMSDGDVKKVIISVKKVIKSLKGN